MRGEEEEVEEVGVGLTKRRMAKAIRWPISATYLHIIGLTNIPQTPTNAITIISAPNPIFIDLMMMNDDVI